MVLNEVKAESDALRSLMNFAKNITVGKSNGDLKLADYVQGVNKFSADAIQEQLGKDFNLGNIDCFDAFWKAGKKALMSEMVNGTEESYIKKQDELKNLYGRIGLQEVVKNYIDNGFASLVVKNSELKEEVLLRSFDSIYHSHSIGALTKINQSTEEFVKNISKIANSAFAGAVDQIELTSADLSRGKIQDIGMSDVSSTIGVVTSQISSQNDVMRNLKAKLEGVRNVTPKDKKYGM